MRKLLYSVIGMLVARLVMSTMRRSSRRPALDQRVDKLQNKFRSLDTV
ncbi:MAG TPA: hypothetical protein VFR18_13705 [Terriglobia bacterium]|nr:hypothetical protein [Terriglobia bacterium]